MSMRIHFDGIKANDDAIQIEIKQWAQQTLQPRLGDTAANLVVSASRAAGKKKPVVVKMHLHLPRRHTLVASAQDENLYAALSQAKMRLMHQLGRHLERLRRQSDYRQKARRQRLRQLKQPIHALPDAFDGQAEKGIESLLPRVEQVARRELAYLRNIGELTGSYPTVQDVMDEAVAAVKSNWQPDEQGEALQAHLLREVFNALDAEVKTYRTDSDVLSLDQAPEQDARDQAEVMVEEDIHEFYQPDEVLRLSDILPDKLTSLPETVLEEVQNAYALERLCDLPILWRRAWMLFTFDKFSSDDIAVILEVELVQVEKWINQTNDFMLAHLSHAGFAADWSPMQSAGS